MADTYLITLRAVAEAITRRFDLQAPATIEYPGFLSIAEKNINDDVDTSERAWACGPSEVDSGVWTGTLMSEYGAVIEGMHFAVRPKSGTPEDIADAIYGHGISDRYGVRCDATDCPPGARMIVWRESTLEILIENTLVVLLAVIAVAVFVTLLVETF